MVLCNDYITHDFDIEIHLNHTRRSGKKESLSVSDKEGILMSRGSVPLAIRVSREMR